MTREMIQFGTLSTNIFEVLESMFDDMPRFESGLSNSRTAKGQGGRGPRMRSFGGFLGVLGLAEIYGESEAVARTYPETCVASGSISLHDNETHGRTTGLDM